jgi:type 1 glutamine amidotransferase
MTVKALVLCGDYWHPPQVPRKGLEGLDGGEFSLDWIDDARAWSPECLAAYELVILTKSDNVSAADQTRWMTDAAQAAFADYVRRGNGLLAVHSGTAEYDLAPVLRGVLGGVFASHPDQCPVTVQPRQGHPLSAGSSPFTMKDEHYVMAMDDPQADVFLTTRSEHGQQPGGWRRREGQGRVAVLTPGHNVEVWLHPAYQALLRNAMRWCGGML